MVHDDCVETWTLADDIHPVANTELNQSGQKPPEDHYMQVIDYKNILNYYLYIIALTSQ